MVQNKVFSIKDWEKLFAEKIKPIFDALKSIHRSV
jgi:hypothetical protein